MINKKSEILLKSKNVASSKHIKIAKTPKLVSKVVSYPSVLWSWKKVLWSCFANWCQKFWRAKARRYFWNLNLHYNKNQIKHCDVIIVFSQRYLGFRVLKMSRKKKITWWIRFSYFTSEKKFKNYAYIAWRMIQFNSANTNK